MFARLRADDRAFLVPWTIETTSVRRRRAHVALANGLKHVPMSLRIMLSVRRCSPATRGRVRYQHGDARLIPEELVLRRWKDRSNEPSAKASGVRFDGCRLSPGTWTLLRQWLAQGLRQEDLTDPAVLKQYAEMSRVARVTLRAPQASKFVALLSFLEQKGVLRDVVERPRSRDNLGLPDLFLYRADRKGRVHGGRFVEVKRWDRRRMCGNVCPWPRKRNWRFSRSSD